MGLLSFISDVGTNYFNKLNTENTNATNKSIADSTNQANMAMNAQNIAFQRETNDLNYERQLAENNLTRQREDTAYSRAASDLESAGLSKTLAAGQPASSNALQSSVSSAPENKFQMQRYEQKAFQAQAVGQDLDLLESLQKIKNIQSTDLHNSFQEWYNNFAEDHNLLPGSSPWYNHWLGINAIGSGILDYIANKGVGSETENAIDSVVQSEFAKNIANKFGFNFVPQVSSSPTTLTESSKGHSSLSIPTFNRTLVNDLPLEESTKKVLNDSATEVSNHNSSANIPVRNLIKDSSALKSYVKNNLPVLSKLLNSSSTRKKGLTALALLSLGLSGNASMTSFIDSDKLALTKMK